MSQALPPTRIVVSGTHASGKSTLISDFVLRHPEFVVLPDPYDLVDDVDGSLSANLFARQLRASADRLAAPQPRSHVIAERGPIDFLAYILAVAELTNLPAQSGLVERAIEMTAAALESVDVLAVLPLSAGDPIHVSDEEHVLLRATMNDILLDLIDDPDIVGDRLEMVELTGDPATRVGTLERALDAR